MTISRIALIQGKKTHVLILCVLERAFGGSGTHPSAPHPQPGAAGPYRGFGGTPSRRREGPTADAPACHDAAGIYKHVVTIRTNACCLLHLLPLSLIETGEVQSVPFCINLYKCMVWFLLGGLRPSRRKSMLPSCCCRSSCCLNIKMRKI